MTIRIAPTASGKGLWVFGGGVMELKHDLRLRFFAKWVEHRGAWVISKHREADLVAWLRRHRIKFIRGSPFPLSDSSTAVPTESDIKKSRDRSRHVTFSPPQHDEKKSSDSEDIDKQKKKKQQQWQIGSMHLWNTLRNLEGILTPEQYVDVRRMIYFLDLKYNEH